MRKRGSTADACLASCDVKHVQCRKISTIPKILPWQIHKCHFPKLGIVYFLNWVYIFGMLLVLGAFKTL